MGDREELESLRRLSELEKRAAPAASYTPPKRPDIGAPPTGISIDTWRGMPPEQRAAMQDQASRPWGSGVPKLAYDVGGTVTDATGSPGAGMAANMATNALPNLLSSFRIPGPQSMTQKPAEWLMQQAVKPSQADRETGRAAAGIKTMLEEGFGPTEGGMDKATRLANALHQKVDAAIAPSTAEVSINDIGQKYLPQYEKAIGQSNSKADLASVIDEWNAFQKGPLVGGQETIPVQLAHILKQGTQRSVNAKSGYGEMGSTAAEAQKTIARLLREAVAEAEPGVAAPLSAEAAIRNAKDVMTNAATRGGNRNLIGMAGAAQSPGVMAAMLADSWTGLKSLGARTLYEAGKPSTALPLALTGATAQQTDKQRMAEYLRKRAEQ